MDPIDPAAASAPPVMPAPEPTPVEISPPMLVERDQPDVPQEVTNNVRRIIRNIEQAKAHWEKDFHRMRRDMDFVSGLMWHEQQGYEDERYRVYIALHYIRQRTATLFAKNPTAVFRRKRKLDFLLWDENPSSLQEATMVLQTAQQMQAQVIAQMPPEMAQQAQAAAQMQAQADPRYQAAQSLIQDYAQGMQRRQQIERIGRTMELLWDHLMTEPVPNTKLQMKQMIRRVLTVGVGFVKLGFQRVMEPRPDNATRIADLTERLATIERLRADMADGEVQAVDAEAEELRMALLRLQSEPEVILREGAALDFPRADAVIPDPRTRSLKGWIGADWLAEEFVMPASRVKEIYGVDLSTAKVTFDEVGKELRPGLDSPNDRDATERNVRVWQYYERSTGTMYTVADGWPNYLEDPRPPEVKLERFFPYYALTFNDIEHEKRIYPPSDTELIRSPQMEYNRVREALRDHRYANRPLYVSPMGSFEKTDKASLSGYSAHSVVMLAGLKEGQSAQELLQPVQKVAIDPNAYETESIFNDILRGTGQQEANLGITNGDTATQASIANTSSNNVQSSDADELDEMLSDLARDFGEVCFANMSAEVVKEIAGPGALWPELSQSDIQKELLLDVEAGSSGRPNRAQDLANFERIAPFMLQVPGVSPSKLAEYMWKLVDDRIDVADFLDPAAQSITAMNAMAKPATGNPATEPTQQGAQGSQNSPSTDKRPGGSQPAYGPSGNNVGTQ